MTLFPERLNSRSLFVKPCGH